MCNNQSVNLENDVRQSNEKLNNIGMCIRASQEKIEEVLNTESDISDRLDQMMEELKKIDKLIDEVEKDKGE